MKVIPETCRAHEIRYIRFYSNKYIEKLHVINKTHPMNTSNIVFIIFM